MQLFSLFSYRAHLKLARLWRPLFFLAVLMAGMVLALGNGRQPASGKAWSPVPVYAGGPDCSSSPFGNVLELFAERELFVGDTGTHPVFVNLNAFTMNLNDQEFLDETDLVDIPNGNNPSAHTAVAADLNGDGETEFVQTFVTSGGQYYISRYNADTSVSSYQLSGTAHSQLATAAGNIVGEDSERDEVVLVSRNSTGALTVGIWDGPANGNQIAVWRSTTSNRNNATLIDVATGNFNNNNKDDIALAFRGSNGALQVVVLEYDPAYESGSGDNYEYHLNDLAMWSASLGQQMDVQITTARLDDDFTDEIVLAYDQDDPGSSLAEAVQLRVLYLDETQLVEAPTMRYTIDNTRSYNFGLGSGDVNFNGRDEVVVTFDSNGGTEGNGLAVKVLQGEGFSTPAPTLTLYDDWFQSWTASGGDRDRARYMDAAVGDLNRDGYAEIALSIDDGRGLEVLYLSHDLLGTNTLPPGHALNLDATQLDTPTALALGDQDNNSLKGVYATTPDTGDCRPITERRVTTAVFTPPFWQNIQLAENSVGAIGRDTNSQQNQERAFAYERSHSISGYIGLGLGAEFGPAGFEANTRVTAGEEYSQSDNHASGIYTSTTTSVRSSADAHFVTFEESHYDCYGYTVQENSVPITDTASLRTCEFLGTATSAAKLPTWEGTYGPTAVTGATEALSWTPAVQDWASLALFRDDFTTQSSGTNAGLAVDGDLVGNVMTMTATNEENNPWWQVDLGQVEQISKVRLWNRDDRQNCLDRVSCLAMLTDVYVFVSEVPFTSNDPAILLNDPNVHHYSLADISPLVTVTTADPTGRVTTFQTLSNEMPIDGRYVRVQIARNDAILSLAEVQIFSDHVDPDRYPVDVRDPAPDDGFFEVQVYDPFSTEVIPFEWVDARGNLLWKWDDYDNNNSQLNYLIGPGGVTLDWSLNRETGSSQLDSHAEGHSNSVGVEFEMEAGFLAQVQLGGAVEVNTGVTQEESFGTSWGEAFNMGGELEGFPSSYNNQNWALDCRYRIRPYFYEITEESTFAVKTPFTVLDYLVPDDDSFDLDREEDLQHCRNGNQTSPTPLSAPDTGSLVAGGDIIISVLGNDAGNNLQVVSVADPAHGTAAFAGRTITYTPDSGFIGDDTFSYTMSDGTLSSTAAVTVTVTPNYLYLPVVVR